MNPLASDRAPSDTALPKSSSLGKPARTAHAAGLAGSKPSSMRQMLAFLKVVEAGSFAAAAEILDLSASAVSKSIASLEARLALQLLNRSSRGFTLTDAGHFLYDRLARQLRELEQTLDEVEGFRTTLAGTIRIAAAVAFGSTQLVALAERFHTRHPRCTLRIDLDDKAENLADADLDLALRITRNPPAQYAARRLASIDWSYCASPAYLARAGRPAAFEDLGRHACLVYPELSDNGCWTCDDGESVRRVKVDAAFAANSSLALLAAVRRGMGIAYLPTYLSSDDLATGALVPLFPDCRTAQPYALYALYLPSRYANPRIRAFIDFLVEALAPPPWEQTPTGGMAPA